MPPTIRNIEEAATLHKIAGNTLRLRIIAAIAEQPRTPQELADLLLQPKNKIQQHLTLLRESGLATSEAGRYRISDDNAFQALRRTSPEIFPPPPPFDDS